VKVFKSGACRRAEWEARLQGAAEVWATLAHPQLVPVQRGGWWDGVPYAVSDYIAQGSLADKLADERYALRTALRLVEQVAEIVAYLHRQGVVHGNLKPGNVLLAADGIPRVADLRFTSGLCVAPLSEAAGDSADAAGVGYLAPELVKNLSAEPNLSADIYGIGLILYELLTGRQAFAGRHAREVLDKVRSQDPTPPSALNSAVKGDVEAFCLHCLGKNPWRRYARAHDLAMRLRYLQENADSRPGSGAARSRRRPSNKDISS
jgi:serine/threonine protein kinase